VLPTKKSEAISSVGVILVWFSNDARRIFCFTLKTSNGQRRRSHAGSFTRGWTVVEDEDPSLSLVSCGRSHLYQSIIQRPLYYYIITAAWCKER